MAGLPQLPQGVYYVANRGAHLMDHKGNLFVVEQPRVESPVAEVKDWRSGLPNVALNPASVAQIKRLKASMATLPVENFLSIGIGADGSITFEDWQPGDEVHVNVDVDRIVTKARESRSLGCAAYHNHCTGETHMSEADKQLTALLERKLAAAKISFLEHGVVPGHPEQIREAQPQIVTSYDLREARDKRLWGSGGPPPMPWSRWGQRQVEAVELPTEYPRDSFDEQTLVDQVVEQVTAICHSIDPGTRRRIMTRALQQMEADAS